MAFACILTEFESQMMLFNTEFWKKVTLMIGYIGGDSVVQNDKQVLMLIQLFL